MSELDCQRCGACCFATHPEHVPLSGEDHARLLPSEQERLVEFRGVRCFMRVAAGRCVNLEEDAGRFSCRIYPRRPQVCRDLERGSAGCEFERHRHLGA